jgi:hypothetical protein
MGANLPKPTTRPFTAAAIGAGHLEATSFFKPVEASTDPGKRESMCAGVGGDIASNVKKVGVPTPGGTTATTILASSCFKAFQGCLRCSKNISRRRSEAEFANGACVSSEEEGLRVT